MVLSDEKKKEYMKRLLLARMRLLCDHGFYGLLLMHMIYAIDESCETAATDGKRIFFGPKFLDELTDDELDFILVHEILHVALKHCFRKNDRDPQRFNVACDIVINSNILLSENMDLKKITLKKYGESMHLTPNGNEGHLYTAEEVYEMLSSSPKHAPSGGGNRAMSKKPDTGSGAGAADRKGGGSGNAPKGSNMGRAENETGKASDSSETWDDHTRWGMEEEEDELCEVWQKRIEDACEAISIRDPGNQRGTLPAWAARLFKELRTPQTDWRTILNGFIQEEIVDYSFMPPDRRSEESGLFLPDFNDKDEVVEDILFMIDTSGSMSDDLITAAYSEVKGAIDQFDGKLKGWLGFFDAGIIEPQPFEDEAEFRKITPAGGGGTDFRIIFEYVRTHMQDKPPASIIILTDGYAPFPRESLAGGIPVLWLLNNEEVTPPWGKIARIR